MDKKGLINLIPTFASVVLLGAAAWLTSFLNTAVSPMVVGIIAGMLVRTAAGSRLPWSLDMDKTIKVFIPAGIILYGTHLEFHRLAEVPSHAWLQLLVEIVIIFLIVYKAGAFLKIPRSLSMLIGVGTAICGASAIILTAPLVMARSEETAKALLVITVLGVIGVLAWPTLGHMMGLESEQYALFCATTLHQTGMVKTAALAFGPRCSEVATVIKLARVATIILLIPLVGFFARYKSLYEVAESQKRLDIGIPWFLWVFIIVGLLFSYVRPLSANVHYFKPLASIIWTMAMVGVGLTVDIRQVASSIFRPFLLGFLAWAGAVAVFLIGTL